MKLTPEQEAECHTAWVNITIVDFDPEALFKRGYAAGLAAARQGDNEAMEIVRRATRELQGLAAMDKPAPINSPADPAGWKCPNCSGAHPQHVKTCPVDNRTMGEKLRGSNS